MITINLYDYKRIIRDVGIQRHLAMVAAATVIVLLICCGTWMLQKMWIWTIESDLAEVETKVAAATPDYNAVQQMKKQQSQYKKIITGIDKLRSSIATPFNSINLSSGSLFLSFFPLLEFLSS